MQIIVGHSAQAEREICTDVDRRDDLQDGEIGHRRQGMRLWIALAKPSQAVALVRAAVPEGWGARLLATIDPLNEDARKAFEELKLEPGAVHHLPSIVNVASYRPRVL